MYSLPIALILVRWAAQGSGKVVVDGASHDDTPVVM